MEIKLALSFLRRKRNDGFTNQPIKAFTTGANVSFRTEESVFILASNKSNGEIIQNREIRLVIHSKWKNYS